MIVAMTALMVLQCDQKRSPFFGPSGINISDDVSPTFRNHQPPNTVNVFSGRGGAMVTVEDDGSGVDPQSVTATLPDNTPLPVTTQPVSPNEAMITVDLSDLTPETTAKIAVRASDNVGNEGLTTFDFFYDPRPPRVEAGFPAAETESSEDTFTFTVTTVVEDPSFASTTGRIFDAGADGACAGGDDVPIAEAESSEAEFEFSFTVSNPLGEGEDPLTVRYCLQVEARDGAAGKTGQPDPNTTLLSSLATMLWSRQLDIGVSFLDIPEGQGVLAPGRYNVDVRVGFGGVVVGTVAEDLLATGPNALLIRNPDALFMTDAARIVHLDTFTPAGGGALTPAQDSPLVGFSQYGWCSQLDLLGLFPAIVRMRDVDGLLVQIDFLTALPDNPAGTQNPICGFVNVREPDRVVEVELDTKGTQVRLIGACQRNAPADDLEGPCTP